MFILFEKIKWDYSNDNIRSAMMLSSYPLNIFFLNKLSRNISMDLVFMAAKVW